MQNSTVTELIIRRLYLKFWKQPIQNKEKRNEKDLWKNKSMFYPYTVQKLSKYSNFSYTYMT